MEEKRKKTRVIKKPVLKYFRTAARWNSLRIHWHFQETYPNPGTGEKLEKEVLCDSQIIFLIFIFLKKMCVYVCRHTSPFSMHLHVTCIKARG